jgi:hypothetical protein
MLLKETTGEPAVTDRTEPRVFILFGAGFGFADHRDELLDRHT